MSFFQDKRFTFVLVAAMAAVIGMVFYSYRSTGTGGTYSPQTEPPASIASSEQPQQESPRDGAVMPACICHSKNPSLVKMHDALEGQDCGQCHRGGENLMDPNRPPTQKTELENRKKTEEVCKNCHVGDKVVVSNKTPKNKTKISGGFFCPKCEKQVTLEDKTCGTCGGTIEKRGSEWVCSTCGPLVDVDKIAAISKENPSNDICRLCHYDDKKLALDHNGNEAYNKSKENAGGLADCLACHEAHNQCGGCHF